MKNNDTIESVESILCAFKKRFKSQADSIVVEDIFFTTDEIPTSGITRNSKGIYYYGMVTVGNGDTATLEFLGGGSINIPSQNQIIELFQRMTTTTNNTFFRGWKINIKEAPDLNADPIPM